LASNNSSEDQSVLLLNGTAIEKWKNSTWGILDWEFESRFV
jgi:hypothetical protein